MAGEHKPVAPLVKYVGGKRWLARRIIAMLPPHTCYVEPFGGMSAVLMAKPRSKVEVWNDIDGGLANVMRCVKYHPDELERELSFMLMHRGEQLRWLTTHPGETDIQRAARWIMVRHLGFQGRAKKGFAVSKTRSNKPIPRLVEQMRAVSQRLQSITIEHLPWQRVIDLYDGKETVFFLDPPYADGDQKFYDHAFSADDHAALRERLRSVRGRWMLTYGDYPLIRDLYRDCHIEEVRRMRTLNQTTKRDYVELIITP